MALGFTRPPSFGQTAPRSPSTTSPFVNQQNTTQSAPTPYVNGYTPSPWQSAPALQNQAAQQGYNTIYRNTINQGITNAGPELTYNAAERARLEAQGAFLGGNYNQREGALRSDYNANMRNADLDLNAIGVRRGAANRDAAYYSNLLGLMPYYGNLSAKERERALGANKQQGIMERLGIGSDYTGRGAYFSGMRSLKSYDSILREQNQNLGAEIGYGRDILGQTEKTMGLQRSKDMTGDQLALLDIEAQKVGVSRDKYRASLEQGLASLGYDKFMSMSDLLGKLNSQDYQQAQLARQILESAAAAGQALSSGQVGGAYGSFN